jgi:hypothetical protein
VVFEGSDQLSTFWSLLAQEESGSSVKFVPRVRAANGGSIRQAAQSYSQRLRRFPCSGESVRQA